jgi:PUA domain protein
MPEKHRRYFLRDKEAKALLNKAPEKLRTALDQVLKGKTSLEVVETDFAEIFLISGKPLLFKSGNNVYPTLVFNEFLAVAPKAVVDMGAVPYVCKGANIMAPGIRRYEGDFKKGDTIYVVDEKHGKALAVGEVLYDHEQAKEVKQGVVVRNVHFVSDEVWEFVKKSEEHSK